MKSDYIVITRDMLELGLRGSKLLVYALVYSFSRDAESDYHGSAVYVANWCGISKPQALDILKDLTSSGLIERDDREGRPHYRVASGRKTDRSENRPQGSENRPLPLPPTPPIPNTESKEIFIDSLDSPRVREDLQSFGEYVRMTSAEHDKLVQRFGTADAARLCELLDAYLTKKPNAYKSHYRAALGWPVARLQEEKLTQQRMKNAREAGLRAAGQPVRTTNYAALAEADARRKAIEDKYKDK